MGQHSFTSMMRDIPGHKSDDYCGSRQQSDRPKDALRRSRGGRFIALLQSPLEVFDLAAQAYFGIVHNCEFFLFAHIKNYQVYIASPSPSRSSSSMRRSKSIGASFRSRL